MKKIGIFCCLLLCVFIGFSQQSWNSKHVKLNKNGSLGYTPDEKGNIIPDFSGVGYYGNKKQLPFVPVVKTVEAADSNNRHIIQLAIDEVAKLPLNENGFRGAILLRKGVYKIWGTIKITASGIVLRGEGQETKLLAAGKGQRNLIAVAGTGSIKETAGT
ncbi:MAG: hypothetical protein V4676_13170, partial [Bacteroidota bacterium]